MLWLSLASPRHCCYKQHGCPFAALERTHSLRPRRSANSCPFICIIASTSASAPSTSSTPSATSLAADSVALTASATAVTASTADVSVVDIQEPKSIFPPKNVVWKSFSMEVVAAVWGPLVQNGSGNASNNASSVYDQPEFVASVSVGGLMLMLVLAAHCRGASLVRSSSPNPTFPPRSAGGRSCLFRRIPPCPACIYVAAVVVLVCVVVLYT